ncbi:MAG TPA: hypothetical protein VF030_09915 [Solirubrobacterales bacterium]
MIRADPLCEQVCARLFDYFSTRAGWHRRTWDLGLCLGLRELEEAVTAEDQGYLSPRSVAWLSGSLRRPAGRDPGVGDSALRRSLQGCLASTLKAGNAEHLKLGHIASNLESSYLERWAHAVEARPSDFDAEQIARALAEHLLDHGFDSRLLHRWLAYHVKYNPDELTLPDLIRVGAALTRQPSIEFEIVAGVFPLPGNKRPENWMGMDELRVWVEREGYSLSNLRVGGGIRFKIAAPDKWSAVAIAAQRLEQYEARVRIGTRDRALRIAALWVAGTDGEEFARRPSRKVDVLALERQERLYESAAESPIDSALQLAAPMDDGPATSAVAGGWAAIETVLTAPGDGSNVLAADRMADIVACSYIRAELTKLAVTYMQDHEDALAGAIRASDENRERCRLLLLAIEDPATAVQLTDATHAAAIARVERVLRDPKRELTEIRERAQRSFRRLYRHRNLLLHGGLRDAVGVNRSLHAVAPLVGAGLDRLAHAWIVEGLEPLALAARARLAMELVGSTDSGSLVDLLER